MPTPDWIEHAVTIVLILCSVVTILIGVIAKGVCKAFKDLTDSIGALQNTITLLFKKYDDHEHRLSVLEGSHDERTRTRLSCFAETGK